LNFVKVKDFEPLIMSQTHGMFDKTVKKIMWTVDIFYITENEMQKRHKHEDQKTDDRVGRTDRSSHKGMIRKL